MIAKTKKGFVVKSEKTGKPLSRPLPSKEAAVQRLHQVEFFKRHPEAGGKKGR